jgi:hypothetical protein
MKMNSQECLNTPVDEAKVGGPLIPFALPIWIEVQAVEEDLRQISSGGFRTVRALGSLVSGETAIEI